MIKKFADLVRILDKIKNTKNKKILTAKQIRESHENLEAFKTSVQELQYTLNEATSLDLTGIETAGMTLANLYTNLVDILCYTQDIQELVIKMMKQYDCQNLYNKKEL